jgi:hypothetical protein
MVNWIYYDDSEDSYDTMLAYHCLSHYIVKSAVQSEVTVQSPVYCQSRVPGPAIEVRYMLSFQHACVQQQLL